MKMLQFYFISPLVAVVIVSALMALGGIVCVNVYIFLMVGAAIGSALMALGGWNYMYACILSA